MAHAHGQRLKLSVVNLRRPRLSRNTSVSVRPMGSGQASKPTGHTGSGLIQVHSLSAQDLLFILTCPHLKRKLRLSDPQARSACPQLKRTSPGPAPQMCDLIGSGSQAYTFMPSRLQGSGLYLKLVHANFQSYWPIIQAQRRGTTL